MIETLKLGYESGKAALGIAQGFTALKTEAAVNQAVMDMQRHVMETQRAIMDADELHAADRRRIADLEQEVVRLKDWSAEKQRYQLENMRGGSVAYTQKAGIDERQAAHWLCANCFDQGRKSFMQKQGEVGPHKIYECGSCKGKMTVDRSEGPI